MVRPCLCSVWESCFTITIPSWPPKLWHLTLLTTGRAGVINVCVLSTYLSDVQGFNQSQHYLPSPIKTTSAVSSNLYHLIMLRPLTSSPLSSSLSTLKSLHPFILHFSSSIILSCPFIFSSGIFLCVGAVEHNRQCAPPGECTVWRGGRQCLHRLWHADKVPGQGKMLHQAHEASPYRMEKDWI